MGSLLIFTQLHLFIIPFFHFSLSCLVNYMDDIITILMSSCGHSYLREEWKARHGNTTIDSPRAPDMQSISLEVLLPIKDEIILSSDRRHMSKLI